MDQSPFRSRFQEAPWYNPENAATIGGAGSIGSWLVFMMSRIINTIYLYEFDTIEQHNLGGQLYAKEHIGEKKADITQYINIHYNPETNIRLRNEFKEDSPVSSVCFSCFDSMIARKMMFEQWEKLEDKEVFIDGRLTAEQFWVYTVTPDKIENYKKLLKEDGEIEDLPCSFKSTTHISAMIASTMVVAYTNFISNQKIEDIRNLPFESKYTASLNLFETN